MQIKSEDQVRTELGKILNIEVGQLTTFKQLGFSEKDFEKLTNEEKEVIQQNKKSKFLSLKPDGWDFCNEKNAMIVCETKNSNETLNLDNINQLNLYMTLCKKKYSNVIGIIYNGYEFKIFINNINNEVLNEKTLKDKDYYYSLLEKDNLDKTKIFEETKKINDFLHYEVGLRNLEDRMIFVASVLVAKRYNEDFSNDRNMDSIKQKTILRLKTEFEKINDNYDNRNPKLYYLTDILSTIVVDERQPDLEKIRDFKISIDSIAEDINSKQWSGEDVMAIFFNEFNRYKGKSENGQVFTPEHIASLMYKISGSNYEDNILDACCGSGTFLTKAMSLMIKEVGGEANKKEVLNIKQKRLFGIENTKSIFALACANMLIHKDGKSNIDFDDARKPTASSKIKSWKITKVLMNPPYEKKYEPIKILENVLDSVEPGAICLFLMPNNKLRTHEKQVRRILRRHRLLKIIKLPNIFQGMASTGEVSIFMFEAKKPQNDEKIIGYWIKEDGLETIKNQGRHDISNKWKNDYEPYWVNAIKTGEDSRYQTKRIIDPNKLLEYPDEYKEIELYEEDFDKVIIDRILFENKDLAEKLSPYSAKNNPNGISHKDWIVKVIKLLKAK